jgi:hypothetical protein
MMRTGAVALGIFAAILSHQLRSLADTIIDVPPSVAPASISGATTLNLFDGGFLPNNFSTFTGSTLNVYGGSSGLGVHANTGSMMNVYGGSLILPEVAGGTINLFGGQAAAISASFGTLNIGGDANVNSLYAFLNSQTTMTSGTLTNSVTINQGAAIVFKGGSVGGQVLAAVGGLLTFEGADFAIDNVPVTGLDNVGSTRQISLAQNSQFTGTLADGTPFAFSSLDSDQVYPGTITLVRAQLPQLPAAYQIPSDAAPRGVGMNQTLTVSNGGALGDNFQAGAGSVVTIQGGTVGSNFEAAGNIVNISGGQIGDRFAAFAGSTINVSGGAIAASPLVQSGATMNLSDGHLGGVVVAGNGALKLSGGKISSSFLANSGSQVTISGADFRLNGKPVSGLDNVGDSVAINVPAGSFQFTGTLTDGKPFAFTNTENDQFQAAITLRRETTAAIGASLIHVPNDAPPASIRTGQQLVLDVGGVIGDDFISGAGGSVVMAGGNIGANFKAVGSQVEIMGGQVGGNFQAFDGTIVHIMGGAIGQLSRAKSGSSVTVDGGSLAGLFAEAGSTITVNGGVAHISATGATVNIYGGQVMQYLIATGGGAVNVFGWQFLFNGAPLAGLQAPGDSALVPFFSGSRLQGKLMDGTPFDFVFSSTGRSPTFFDGSVQLRLTIAIPEPSSLYLLLSNSMMLSVATSRIFSGRRIAKLLVN